MRVRRYEVGAAIVIAVFMLVAGVLIGMGQGFGGGGLLGGVAAASVVLARDNIRWRRSATN